MERGTFGCTCAVACWPPGIIILEPGRTGKRLEIADWSGAMVANPTPGVFSIRKGPCYLLGSLLYR